MRLLVAATGGTIASLPDPETGAVRPAVSAEDLLTGIPELAELAELDVVEVDRVNGWNVTPATMLSVAKALSEGLAGEKYDGAIVTGGTDTIEETAFLCDLLVAREKPVAFAAAMRTGNEVAADGPRNLVNAARVAGSAEARGWGALLVMHDEIHAARSAVKVDSFRPSAFASPGPGPVGHVTPERLKIDLAPARFTVDVPEALDFEVPIIKTYTGMPEGLIEQILDATEARGLVLEGTGAGNVPGLAMAGISFAAERSLPVVFATRVATGGVVPIYGGPGGGITIRELGAIGAGSLTAAKARLLLLAVLATGADLGAAAELFRQGVSTLAPGAFGAD
jgi:L-asparaginase